VEEEETGDVSDMMEEDGEVLENFGDGLTVLAVEVTKS
jgi:hypothetical protein